MRPYIPILKLNKANNFKLKTRDPSNKNRDLPPLRRNISITNKYKKNVFPQEKNKIFLSFEQEKAFNNAKQVLEKYADRLKQKTPFTERDICLVNEKKQIKTQRSPKDEEFLIPNMKLAQKIYSKIAEAKTTKTEPNNSTNIENLKIKKMPMKIKNYKNFRTPNPNPSKISLSPNLNKKEIIKKSIKCAQKIYSPLRNSQLKHNKITMVSPYLKLKPSDISMTSESSQDSINEDYNIWDNTELAMKGVDLNNSSPSFLNILKMRLQNFPTHKESLNNKDIVDYARNLVGYEKINKNVLDKFNDYQCYNMPVNPKKDVNSLKFLSLYYRIRLRDEKTKIHTLFPKEKKKR